VIRDELSAFGLAMHRLSPVSITQSGILVPGPRAASWATRGKEQTADENVAEFGEEAGPATRSREGRRASAAAADSAAQTVQRSLSAALGLEELFDQHDHVRVGPSSSGTVRIQVPLRLFADNSEPAVLVLQVPSRWPTWLPRPAISPTPPMRAWAFLPTGGRIRAHHEYPDGSICACTEDDWRLGVNSVSDFVGFCACWAGKAMHDSYFGWWPGLQHYPAAARVARAKPFEFCGCGSRRQYAMCCLHEDLARTDWDRFAERADAERRYLSELDRRGWLLSA